MAAAALAVGSAHAGLSSTACTRRGLGVTALDAAITSAHRPEKGPAALPASAGARLHLLAGDTHCHVQPPDHPSHVSRGMAETLELARSEGLDFVVLTPHVPSRFFMDPATRQEVLAEQAEIARTVAALDPGDLVVIPGLEYTDHRHGHVGVAFASLERVLDAVPVAEARRRPARFFEEYVAQGGVLVVNHPLLTPLDSMFAQARWDLSWRPWTAPGRGQFPPEIGAVERLAQGYEAYNLAVTHIRDRFLVGDTERTLRATLARIDRQILATGRRISPIGGSDSHTSHLRATTFVLAEQRTPAGIAGALRAGRVCVRDPGACSIEARAPGGAWLGVGASLAAREVVEVRAGEGELEVFLDGAAVATSGDGRPVRVEVPASRCSVLRGRVEEGFSAPIYVNCALP